jgi:hypothetical protein
MKSLVSIFVEPIFPSIRTDALVEDGLDGSVVLEYYIAKLRGSTHSGRTAVGLMYSYTIDCTSCNHVRSHHFGSYSSYPGSLKVKGYRHRQLSTETAESSRSLSRLHDIATPGSPR